MIEYLIDKAFKEIETLNIETVHIMGYHAGHLTVSIEVSKKKISFETLCYSNEKKIMKRTGKKDTELSLNNCEIIELQY